MPLRNHSERHSSFDSGILPSLHPHQGKRRSSLLGGGIASLFGSRYEHAGQRRGSDSVTSTQKTSRTNYPGVPQVRAGRTRSSSIKSDSLRTPKAGSKRSSTGTSPGAGIVYPEGEGEEYGSQTASMYSSSASSESNTRAASATPVPPDEPIEFDKNEFLSSYLADRGFLKPEPLYHSVRKGLRVSVATTGKYVFLPTMSSNDDEYLARLAGLNRNEDGILLFGGEDPYTSEDDDDNGARAYEERVTGAPVQPSHHDEDEEAVIEGNDFPEEHSLQLSASGYDPSALQQPGSVISDRRGSTMSTEIRGPLTVNNNSNSRVPYSVGVIITLERRTKFTDFLVELASTVHVYWSNGVPPTKTFNEERYNAGKLAWILNSKNFNLFIPVSVSSKHQIIENNLDIHEPQLFKNLPTSERVYQDRRASVNAFFQELYNDMRERSNEQAVLEPGTYVYILPILFSNHIPETVYFPSGRVGYKLAIGSRLLKNTLDLGPTLSRVLSDSSANSTTSGNGSLPSSMKVPAIDAPQSSGKLATENNKSILKKVRNSFHMTQRPRVDVRDPNEMFVEYPIDIIRTPPPISISTVNKPVYINRVWTDALSYEISFGQKYVALGSDVPLKMKLAPLAKNISLKRIRVSISEKITFVSKNLEYEFEQTDLVSKDPFSPYYIDFNARKIRQRNFPLLDIRTREQGAKALREEIIENSYNDNLLSYQGLEDEYGRLPRKKKSTDVGITEPFFVDTVLHFPKFERMNTDHSSLKVKNVPPYGIDTFTEVVNNGNSSAANDYAGSHRSHSNVFGFIASHGPLNAITSIGGSNMGKKNSGRKRNLLRTLSHDEDSIDNTSDYDSAFHVTRFRNNSDIPIKSHAKLNNAKRGLYLDSLHFGNIHARHKLQIMLRISRMSSDGETRSKHYEVLIDTPIFLVSDLCNNDNMELPTYDMAINSVGNVPTMNSLPLGEPIIPPPTFTEATAVVTSPIGSPISSPFIVPGYDRDLGAIQHLNLSGSPPSGNKESGHRNNSANSTSGSGQERRRHSIYSGGVPGYRNAKPNVTRSTDRRRHSNIDSVMTSAASGHYYSSLRSASPKVSVMKQQEEGLEGPGAVVTEGSKPPNYEDVINES